MRKVAIIVPLYDRAEFIAAALRSLLAHTADCDLDIIVVDDGSTDKGPLIVRALADQNAQIRMVSTPNQGVARARNAGLGLIEPSCEFVTFLDSDDVSIRGSLAANLAEFDTAPQLELVYGKFIVVRDIDHDTLSPVGKTRVSPPGGVQLGAAVFRRALVDRIGPFETSLSQAEDADFLLRAFERCASYKLTETASVYYRRHSNNMSSDVDVVGRSLVNVFHRSLLRRRADPTVRVPPNFFGVTAPASAPAKGLA